MLTSSQMIPEGKRSAVTKALLSAFQVPGYDDIQALTKGLSGSSVYKITVKGNPYVLRVVTRTETRDNPAQYFDNMQKAAAANIAPAVYYADTNEKVSITEFIAEQPFSISDARIVMAKVIQRVHELPRFSHQVDYIGTAYRFCQRFQDAGAHASSVARDTFQQYLRIQDVYPRNDPGAIVSSHNDLKPDNILFDGRQARLVDWEASFLNDKYVDLASMANFVVRTAKDENDFLNTYFGEEADEYQKARFFLMRQIVHMFCFTLCMGLIPEDVRKQQVGPLSFPAFHDLLWNGEISLASAEAKHEYALVHLQQLESNLFSKRFEEALYIVSQGQHTSSSSHEGY